VDGSEGTSEAAGSVATAAASAVGSLLLVGAIVVVVVHRGRRQADAPRTVDAIENGSPAPADETYGPIDELERADSYHDALATTTLTAGVADFAAAAFVLDAAAGGSIKAKSVRRPNPAYRSSTYVANDETEGI